MTIKATVAKLKELAEQSFMQHSSSNVYVTARELCAVIAHTESQDARIEALEAECARVKGLVPRKALAVALLGLKGLEGVNLATVDRLQIAYAQHDIEVFLATLPATPATAPLMAEGETSEPSLRKRKKRVRNGNLGNDTTGYF